MIILDKEVYVNSITESKFRILKEDPTIYRGQLQRRLLKLKKKYFFTAAEYDKIYPTGANPARSYGYLKHKVYVDNPSFRLIVSSIGTFNYNLASYLGKMVQEITPTEYSSTDTDASSIFMPSSNHPHRQHRFSRGGGGGPSLLLFVFSFSGDEEVES